MRRQVAAIALGLLLWSCCGWPSLAAALLAYLVALALLSTQTARQLLSTLNGRTFLALCTLAAAPGIIAVYRQRAALAEGEGLPWVAASLPDRLRLEHLPAIAPPLISADRPQTFWISTPGSHRVSVRLASGIRSLDAQSLGGGLFRVDYDPRRDGLPRPVDGPVDTSLNVDGRSVSRTLHAVTPLAHPRWFSTSPRGRLAATVSEETDTMIVVSRDGLMARVATDDGPVDCTFVDETHVVVSHRYSHALAWVDLASRRITHRLDLAASQGRLAMSPDQKLLAVALDQHRIAIVDVAQRRVVQRIVLYAAADWLAFGSDGDTMLVTTRQDAALLRLHRDAQGAFQQDAMLKLGRPAVTLARSRKGHHVHLATTDYRPDGSPQLGNHFVQDQVLTVETSTLAVTQRRLTARRSQRQAKPGDVDQGLSPMGLFDSDDGLLVAFAGSDELWRWENASAEPLVIDLGATDLHAPHGVAMLADGTTVVSSPAYGVVGLLPPRTSTPRLLRLAPENATLLHQNRAALRRRIGEHGFYESTRSGISCQSCHLHADSDDAGYNLGDHRLVPTLSVRGLLDTAPYLRDGTYPQIADLDSVAQHLYRGYLRVRAARGETLEAFINGLPRAYVEHLPQALARERRGRAVFEQAGCPQCHSYPAFTNLGQMPMQNLFPDEAAALPPREMLDVPSLLSVNSNPPYLNDGRAATLDAVLSRWNRHNLHGNTQSLNADQRADLVAFLSSL